jgi:antitoxin CptB
VPSDDREAAAGTGGRLASGSLAPDALRRLRWRARRGLLENDLLVGRFLDRDGAALAADAAQALARLLELSEADLLDLLLNRSALPAALDEPAVHQMLARLQSVRVSP